MVTERRWQIRPGDLRGASIARHEFNDHLRSRATEKAAVRDAELIFGELVSNAVRYARTAVEVELLHDNTVALRVADDGDCFTIGKFGPASLQAESGRGLHIVQSLARGVDVSRSEARCTVTAILPVQDLRA